MSELTYRVVVVQPDGTERPFAEGTLDACRWTLGVDHDAHAFMPKLRRPHPDIREWVWDEAPDGPKRYRIVEKP